MIHLPLESMIFNSFKKLKRELKGEAKWFLEKVGATNYRKLVTDMIRHKISDPGKDLKLLTASTLEDVARLSRAARQALGKARLATVTKSA